MKKYRLFSFCLAALLLLSCFLPSCPASASAILDEMDVNAGAALLVDTTYDEAGEILYEKNIHEKMYPASITKVMTGLLVLEAVDRGELSLGQMVTIGENVNEGMFWGASSADLRVGEVLTLNDILHCALIPSANEACNVLAETVSGSIPAFVQKMNERAAQLGCENTHFVNPHGLHDDDHYTTAWDIYLMCREAMKNPTFREIVSCKAYTLPQTEFHPERTIHDTNALISNFSKVGYLYPYAIGIKTGSTNEGGLCLAAAAAKAERTLYSVVLNCERTPGATGSAGYTQFSETIRLFDWGFQNFQRNTILSTTDLQGDLPVTLSRTELVGTQPAGSLEVTLPKDVTAEDFSFVTEWDAESVAAPVAKGQVVGTITAYYKDRAYGSLPLVTVSAAERSQLLYILDLIRTFFSQTWVRIVLIALAAFLLLLVLYLLFFRRRRNGNTRHYGGSRSRAHKAYRGRRRR